MPSEYVPLPAAGMTNTTQFADGIIPVSYAIAVLLVLVSLGTGYCLRRRRRRRLPAFAVALEGDEESGEEDAVTCCGVKSTQRLLSLAVFRTLVAGWFAAILLITITKSDGRALRAYTVQVRGKRTPHCVHRAHTTMHSPTSAPPFIPHTPPTQP